MKRSTGELRAEAIKCRTANAAAIIAGIAGWLEGIPAVEGDPPPHEFVDWWVDPVVDPVVMAVMEAAASGVSKKESNEWLEK